MKQKQTGFTMIEIVLVIALLAILVVSALPTFINITTQARQASRDGVTGAIRSGIQLYRTNDLLTNGAPGNYPASLDGVGGGTDCSSTELCFATVLTQGISDSNWNKEADTTYIYDDGSSTYTYTYDPATGSFNSPDAP